MKIYSPLTLQLQVENSANALETVIELVESSLAPGSDPTNLAEHQERYAKIACARREAAARTAVPPVQVAAEVIPALIAEASAIAESVKAGTPTALATESLAVYRPGPSLVEISHAEAARARAEVGRARDAWSAKAARLLVKATAAIKGAFVLASRALRQPRRVHRPAASRPKATKASAGDDGDGGGAGDGGDSPRPVLTHGHGPKRGPLRTWSFHPGGRPGSWSQRVALAFGGAL
jgi:RIP homotypic interaction motif